MADWDVAATAPSQPQAAPQPTTGVVTPPGGANPMLPASMRVVATGPVKPPNQGKTTWRDPTDDEKKTYPGVSQVSSTGEVKYAPANQGADLDDNAIAMASDKYLQDGSLPNLGIGGAQAKTKIINKAGDTLKSLNLTGSELAGAQAEFASNKAALTNMVKSRSAVASYEGTVNDSLTLAQQWADKALANTGFQTVNKGVNWYKDETGDASYKSLKDAVQTVTNEYARVISNSSTGGQNTSDAARAHAEQLLSAADSPQAFKAAVNILRQEMNFRVNSMDRQIAGLSNSLHSAIGAKGGDGDGDFASFARAYQQKRGTMEGAVPQWQQYKRGDNADTSWRQQFPELSPNGAASKSAAGAANDPLGLR